MCHHSYGQVLLVRMFGAVLGMYIISIKYFVHTFLILTFSSTTIKFNIASNDNVLYLYMSFAWGLSFILTLFAYIADSNGIFPDFLEPGLGTEKCFMKSMFGNFSIIRCIQMSIIIVFR